MEERLCLQWNDFQDNIQRALGEMREDKHLTDVTLACTVNRCPTERVCTEVVPKDFSSDLDELEAKVLSMMEISETRLPSHNNRRAHACKVCGKEGFINNIKDHIEANHLEGISLPCKYCNNFFRTRNGLRRHKAKSHFNSLDEKNDDRE